MDNERLQAFFAYAEQLGHDRQTLTTKGSHTTRVTVESLEQLRALVRPPGSDTRSTRMTVVQSGDHGRPPLLEDRVQGYLYGTGELSDAHRKICQKSFPMTVELVSFVDYTMPHGETVVGPNGPPTVWNYGTMNFYPDSYLTVSSTAFTLNVQNLVMQYQA
jgi:hypothetical protein